MQLSEFLSRQHLCRILYVENSLLPAFIDQTGYDRHDSTGEIFLHLLMHQRILRFMYLIYDLMSYIRIHVKAGDRHYDPVNDRYRGIRGNSSRPGYKRIVDPFNHRIQNVFLGLKMIVQSSARYTDSVE